MLHPHVPEDLKHFGKHLFATFLGLLMALGMESWHQAHRRQKVADEAYLSVLAEYTHNLKRLEAVTKNYKDLPAKLTTLSKWAATIRDARRAGKPWNPPEGFTMDNLSIMDANLRSAAWTMALTSRSVELFPQGRGPLLASTYESFQAYKELERQPLEITGLQIFGERINEEKGSLERVRLTDDELRQIEWSIRNLSIRIDLQCKHAVGIAEKMKQEIPDAK